MGFFPTNTTESAARSGNQYTTNFNNPKFNSHGYSHVCHQAISGEVYVCPIRTKFRTSIAQQSIFKAPHSNPPLPSLPFITSCINYPFLIRKASPGKRQEISVLFFPAQGKGRIRKFIIISGRTVSLLSKRKLRWK